MRNTQSIEESVRHSDIVYNLIGRDYPTKYIYPPSCAITLLTGNRNFTLEDVHVEGTERIVEAVAKYDIDRFVHVSSYNANPDSPSEFYRTKGVGEQVARQIYPETTIVRPAPMFGFEDRLLNRLAGPTNVITSNWMQEYIYPTHAIDVGMALEKMLHDDTTAAETFELYGPKGYTMAEINELVGNEIIKNRRHINIPKKLLKPIAAALNRYIWWPTMSADEVEREFIDQVIDPKAKTYKDLGIEPIDIKSVLYEYLVRPLRRLPTCMILTRTAERIPFPIILRSASDDRAGKAGGEEVSPRS